MRAGQLMTRTVETIGPAESADGAWHRMRHLRIEHLVVVDAGRVVGALTARRLEQAHASGRRALQVGDLMVADVPVASPTTTLERAERLIAEGEAGCVPVVEDGELLGILTATDLQRWLHLHTDRVTDPRWRAYRRHARWPRVARRSGAWRSGAWRSGARRRAAGAGRGAPTGRGAHL